MTTFQKPKCFLNLLHTAEILQVLSEFTMLFITTVLLPSDRVVLNLSSNKGHSLNYIKKYTYHTLVCLVQGTLFQFTIAASHITQVLRIAQCDSNSN